MDKLLNFIAAIEDRFENYHVSVSPLENGNDMDVLIYVSEILRQDTGVTSAFNIYELDEFRNEFEEIEVRTGINEDVARLGKGVNGSTRVDSDFMEHWVEFRVKA